MYEKALSGVKVIQLANFIAAPATGRYLADHGADVIWVEAEKGDPLRYTCEQEGRPQNLYENVVMEYLNGNKRCISLNTKTDEGKAVLFRLLESADVFLTNWRLGALKRAGLDYDSLKERFPKLIYAMILGYGKTGPDKDLPGYDFTAFFSRGGYVQNLRRRGNDPIAMIAGLGDNNVGLMLATGIVTALYQRERTGRGDFVTTSLYETAIFNQSVPILSAQYDGIARQYPLSMYDTMNPLNSAYRTVDDRIIQCAMPDYDPRFEHFCDTIGRSDLFACGEYHPQEKLIQTEGAVARLIDEIQKTFLEHTCAEMDEILRKGDIPHSIAYTYMDILEDPQAEAVGAFYEVTCPNGAVRKATHTPVQLASEGGIDGRRAPLIGENGREILQEYGYSDAEIDALLQSGALYIMPSYGNM